MAEIAGMHIVQKRSQICFDNIIISLYFLTVNILVALFSFSHKSKIDQSNKLLIKAIRDQVDREVRHNRDE